MLVASALAGALWHCGTGGDILGEIRARRRLRAHAFRDSGLDYADETFNGRAGRRNRPR